MLRFPNDRYKCPLSSSLQKCMHSFRLFWILFSISLARMRYQAEQAKSSRIKLFLLIWEKACGVTENIYQRILRCLTLRLYFMKRAYSDWKSRRSENMLWIWMNFFQYEIKKKLYLININVEFWFHIDVKAVDKIVSFIALITMLNLRYSLRITLKNNYPTTFPPLRSISRWI